LAFQEGGRCAGQVSCNGFAGESTLMGKVRRFESTPEGKLVPHAADGKKIVARR
jgi:hypothetical protein